MDLDRLAEPVTVALLVPFDLAAGDRRHAERGGAKGAGEGPSGDAISDQGEIRGGLVGQMVHVDLPQPAQSPLP
jgi:hypothetical protein